MKFQLWLPANVSWSDIDFDKTGPTTRDIYYALPAALALYLIRKLSEVTIIKPLGRYLKIDDDRDGKKHSMRSEMFCEHMWEFQYYAVNFIWALCILWDCSYFWNYSEFFVNYPYQVK